MTKEYFYGGGYSSLNAEKYGNPIGYRANFETIGTSLDARTANQVKEVSKHLNTGLKVFEVAAHSPEVFDAMPKDQLTEIRRLSALTGSEATIHGPMLDPSGITTQGFQELNRKAAEEQLWNALKRSNELTPQVEGKQKGNVVFTMHASTINLPPAEFKLKENGESITKSVLLIDPNGSIQQIKEEPKYFGQVESKLGQPLKFDATKRIDDYNKQFWQKQLTNLSFYTEKGQEAIEQAEQIAGKNFGELEKEDFELLKKQKGMPDVERILAYGEVYLRDAYLNLKTMYDLVYKGSEGNYRKELDKYAVEVAPFVEKFDSITKNPKILPQFAELIEKGVKVLEKADNPHILTPLRDFAIKESSETISNLAFKSYNEFERKGKNSPIISIENHPAQQSLLTTGEDLRDVIEASQKEFVKKVMAEGVSKSEAEKQAKKLIGATWDVGHINMMRRYGYDDNDILNETKAVAPYVKHIHLSDNFGFEHTELPMGMGNVPIKQIMESIDKEAQRRGEKGFGGKKVVEALSWWQHFSEQGTQHAIIPTLQAFSSPIYGMKNAPYWNQAAGTLGGYFGMPLAYMPEKHFSMYGSGFSTLPQDLGGQIPGTQSRFTGTPNA